jgi:hypothetical protein
VACRAAFKQACRIGGGAASAPAGGALVWVCHPRDGPAPDVAAVVVVAVVAVVTVWFVVGVGVVAVVGPVAVTDPLVGVVDVVSLVAVVSVPGLTTTGRCPSGGIAPQRMVRRPLPPAALRTQATGGRHPGIAPRTARPRTSRTYPLLGTAAITSV